MQGTRDVSSDAIESYDGFGGRYQVPWYRSTSSRNAHLMHLDPLELSWQKHVQLLHLRRLDSEGYGRGADTRILGPLLKALGQDRKNRRETSGTAAITMKTDDFGPFPMAD